MLAAASTASASTDGSEAIITDDELAACIGVLRRLCTAAEGDAAAKPSEAFYTPRLKPLRLALLPLIEDFRSTTGASRIDKIRAGKEKQRERHRREQQQKALDRAATDKTRMRRERLEMLGALESADAPRVPDGAVGMVDGLLLEHRQTGGDSTAPLALPPPGEASGSGEPEARLREAGAEEATEEGASDRGSGLLARGRGEADGEGELLHLRACYICKVRYRRLHHLYGSLCPGCAALNEAKRLQTADLRGRVVLLTGARVKIGFQAALKLLRCGARVLATTRFPVDAAARFAALPDFDRWSANLQIFGLDLRDLEALERFCDFLDATEAHLSDIVNNACQTIRRPAQYYRHLIEKELAPHEAPADHRRCLALHEACFGAAAALAAPASKQLLAPLAAPPQRSQGELSQGVPQGGRLVGAPADGAGSAAPAAAVPSALWSQLPVWGAPADGGEAGEAGEAGGEEAAALFPAGAHDVNGQQLDLRTTNSWLLRLGQVRTGEVAEARSRRRAGGASRVCTRRPGVGIGARNQHPRALHPQQPAPRAVAALARRRAAGRQRVCDGGQVLPVQDGQPPAHQHGQGGAQHDDANLRRGARRERRLHELDRHRLDQRREPAAACGAHGREAPLPDAARRG